MHRILANFNTCMGFRNPLVLYLDIYRNFVVLIKSFKFGYLWKFCCLTKSSEAVFSSQCRVLCFVYTVTRKYFASMLPHGKQNQKSYKIKLPGRLIIANLFSFILIFFPLGSCFSLFFLWKETPFFHFNELMKQGLVTKIVVGLKFAFIPDWPLAYTPSCLAVSGGWQLAPERTRFPRQTQNSNQLSGQELTRGPSSLHLWDWASAFKSTDVYFGCVSIDRVGQVTSFWSWRNVWNFVLCSGTRAGQLFNKMEYQKARLK